MTAEILVLRGINVGGHGKLPMAGLRALLQGLGAGQVATYIQSGNAVYRGSLAPGAVADAIEAAHGFRPSVQTRCLEEWEALVEAMPWPEVEDHKALHLFLMAGESPTGIELLEAAKGPEERLCRLDRAVWLHTPKYLSGSTIAERMERLLGVPATARNRRTVVRLRDMARGLG